MVPPIKKLVRGFSTGHPQLCQLMLQRIRVGVIGLSHQISSDQTSVPQGQTFIKY